MSRRLPPRAGQASQPAPPRPRARRTQAQRKADTRARLVAAASQVLAEAGVEGLSVDAVAAVAGRTSGAVYSHFGSKQGLLLALLDGWRQSLLGIVADAIEHSEDLGSRLRAVAAEVVVHPNDDTKRMLALERELWRLAAGHGEMAAALRERAAEGHARMTSGLAAWMAEGRIATVADPATLAVALQALVVGLEARQRQQGDLDVEQVAAALAALLAGG